MTFTQLNARLKNILMGWLLLLGLKECMVECVTLCVKSEVMLIWAYAAATATAVVFEASEKTVLSEGQIM